jgi:Branched-chain amino acid aminotransferase/4-amino-4-deoxychorismate lyase
MSNCVYFNGEVLCASAARVPVDDRAVRVGLGFFETFRTSGGRPHHWSFNRARLERACATAGLWLSPQLLARDEEKLRDVLRRLLDEAGLTDAVFRYTITGGVADDAPGELLTLRPLPSEPPAAGVDLRVLGLRRDNGEWLPRPKSLNQANVLLGARELGRRTQVESDEGLFLARESGCVVETTRQSLAWIVDGRLRFPDPSLGAVEGTCLAWVLGLGISSEPRRAQLEEVCNAEAVIVLNAVRGITPVRAIWDEQDRVPLATWTSHAHPIVVSLRRQWCESLAGTAR